MLVAIGLAWLFQTVTIASRSNRGADIRRQWVVCQYLLHGVDPYRVSGQVLDRLYGPIQSLDPRKTKVFVVPDSPQARNVSGVLTSVGPSEATYPPSVALMLTITVGLLPRPWVIPSWALVNLAAIGLFAAWCHRRLRCSLEESAPSFLLILGLLLLWGPTQQTVRDSQFCIIAVVALLAALDRLNYHEIASGILLALALIKPSLTLPFLVLPFLAKRKLALALGVGIHLLATLVVASFLRMSPFVLLGEWLTVARYFMQGAYSVHEVVVKVGLGNSPVGTSLSVLILASGLLYVVLCRRADRCVQVKFLILLSLLWTYHGTYDFVLLFLYFVIEGGTPHPRRRAVSFLTVNLALALPLLVPENLVLRILGWACRLVLLALFMESGVALWRSASVKWDPDHSLDKVVPHCPVFQGDETACP